MPDNMTREEMYDRNQEASTLDNDWRRLPPLPPEPAATLPGFAPVEKIVRLE